MRLSMATAAVVLLAVGISSCSSGDPDPFAFADDDLCERVSEAEVAEWIAAEFDWNGTATRRAQPETGSCEWTLESTDGEADVFVMASDASLWQDFDGNTYDFKSRLAESGLSEYPPSGGSVEIGAWVAGHPDLSDDVVVHNGGFGMFAFGVPPGPWLQVMISAPDGDGEWDNGVAAEDLEAHYFAVANRFLQELGWAS